MNQASASNLFVHAILQVAFFLLPFFLFVPAAYAVIETYEFKDKSLEQRYLKFAHELRCPKCQNQNLSGSNSPIAQDLRSELYRLLIEGKTDQEIIDFMTARYGDYILYRPPVQGNTWVLWFSPLVLFLIGGIVVGIVLYQHRPSLSTGRDQADQTKKND